MLTNSRQTIRRRLGPNTRDGGLTASASRSNKRDVIDKIIGLVRAAIQRNSQDIVIQLAPVTEYISISSLCIGKWRPLGPSYNTDELIDKREADGTAIVGCRRALFLAVGC